MEVFQAVFCELDGKVDVFFLREISTQDQFKSHLRNFYLWVEM